MDDVDIELEFAAIKNQMHLILEAFKAQRTINQIYKQSINDLMNCVANLTERLEKNDGKSK